MFMISKDEFAMLLNFVIKSGPICSVKFFITTSAGKIKTWIS